MGPSPAHRWRGSGLGSARRTCRSEPSPAGAELSGPDGHEGVEGGEEGFGVAQQVGGPDPDHRPTRLGQGAVPGAVPQDVAGAEVERVAVDLDVDALRLDRDVEEVGL